MSLFLKRLLVQISMVFPRGMFLKRESISKLSMKLPESGSTYSLAKLNESFNLCIFAISQWL